MLCICVLECVLGGGRLNRGVGVRGEHGGKGLRGGGEDELEGGEGLSVKAEGGRGAKALAVIVGGGGGWQGKQAVRVEEVCIRLLSL